MLIFAAIIAIFVYGMTGSMLGTILPELSNRFALSPRQNGTIALAQALGLMLASLGVGPLLDNLGNKPGLILGLALMAASLLGLPRVRGFRSIIVLLFLLGCGGGIVTTGADALASSLSAAHRAVTLNLVNIFFGLGALATPFLAANLLKRNWVRLCYLICGLTIAALAIQAATRMPAATGAGLFVAQAGPAVASPLLWLLGLFMFLYIGCEVGIWNWLVRHLIAQGVPEKWALNILSLGFALGLLSGRLAILPVLAHAAAAKVTLGAAACMAVTTFLMLRARDKRVAAALVFVVGLSMAPVFPTTLAIVGGAFPQITGTAMGIVITFGWAGLAVSSRVIGSIAGGDPARLRKALLIIPASAVLMVGFNLAILAVMK
ncbi:MAG: MFS transporter [Acidobacteriaceae bacterium]